MNKLLITGFEPFGGEKINPSWDAVSRLPDTVNGYELKKLLVPVVFSEGAEWIKAAANDFEPDVILCIGQAGGIDAITPEMVGINLRHASIPDNKGNTPQDEPILKDGEAAYFSTLPVRKIAEAINEAGVRARVSYSAGAYVCNDVIYTLLEAFKSSRTRVGFIHVPYCREQGKEPFMDMDDIIKALTVAIENL